MFWQILTLSVLAVSCGVAFRWGGFDERLAAAGLIIAVTISNIVTDGSYRHTETDILVVDVSLLLGLLALALRSDRFWPLWAAAFQLVGTMVHFASILQTGDSAWAYFAALILWTFPVFVALIAGTWLEGRSRRSWEMSAR